MLRVQLALTRGEDEQYEAAIKMEQGEDIESRNRKECARKQPCKVRPYRHREISCCIRNNTPNSIFRRVYKLNAYT
jgi:hypothetical protein